MAKRELLFGTLPKMTVAKPRGAQPKHRVLDARPDTTDFRDRMYEPTLVEVPSRIDLAAYRAHGVPVLDQGAEGACTGFGLATVANYLLRHRRVVRDTTDVSPWMFYAMAKRYDEWPGEAYEGSSARGAMKGWNRHGVCAGAAWLGPAGAAASVLTDARAADAAHRPLGAYFRVNHKDLVAMHAAIAEVGVLFATAVVHDGWDAPGADGLIPPGGTELGGHAFAIVAFDERGFWIQNSWGTDWGADGFGLLTYDDWLARGTDVWVARLGVPVSLRTATATASSRSASAGDRDSYAFRELRPHIVSIGNDGALRPEGTYGTSEADVEEILRRDFPRITQGWAKKRLLLYAHGGLVGESGAVQRIADYRAQLLQNEIYPLAFVWRTDAWTTFTNILQDAIRHRRPEGILDAAKDFLLDRVDDALEPLARTLGGKAEWDEMKENGGLATIRADGAARIVARHLAELVAADPSVELHAVSHSAGSIIHAPLVQLLTATGAISDGPMQGSQGLGLRIATSTLWAPACTVDLFKGTYLPAIRAGAIGRFAIFTLTDDAEQDDNCAGVYHKSLLYLVSNALEERPRIPGRRDGEPILGMEKFIEADADLSGLFTGTNAAADWVRAPSTEPAGGPSASRATRHGDFDDDEATVRSTLARILAATETGATFSFQRSAEHMRDQRQRLA